MRPSRSLVLFATLVGCGPAGSADPPTIPPAERTARPQPPATMLRVATYNIRFLSATALPREGRRKTRLIETIRGLDADLIGLQEVEDRAALKQVFDPGRYSFLIDDDSDDEHDVAIVFDRRVVELLDGPADLDADNDQFLFTSRRDDREFVNRRDVLWGRFRVRGTGETVVLFVVHPKSRRDGRATSEPLRVDHARKLLTALKARFDGEAIVVVGDFNDTPDDRSLNILESGDPDAAGEIEDRDGPFLVNLCEPLTAAGHVTVGRDDRDIVGGRIDTVDRDSRRRNDALRSAERPAGDVLFDQILISPTLLPKVVPGSVRVFDGPSAVEGRYEERASDHLPVSMTLKFATVEATPPPDDGPATGAPDGAMPADGLRIVAILPNPPGDDAGHEEIHLAAGAAAMPLDGHTLHDSGGRTMSLAGLTIPAGRPLVLTLDPEKLQLSNDGGEVVLRTADGTVVDRFAYSKNDARKQMRLRR